MIPSGHIQNPTGNYHYSHLKIVLFCANLKSGDGRTTCVKIVITIGRDCWSAEWISNKKRIFKAWKKNEKM